MHVVQYDRQHRVVWPENASGFYHWTNTWYYDLDNPGGPTSSRFQIELAYQHGRLPMVQTSAFRITDPPHSGIVTSEGQSLHLAGLAPFTSPAPIWNVVRLGFWSGGLYVGYKLWRMPVPPDEIIDQLLSPAVYTHMVDTVSNYLLLAKITTAGGLLIDEIRVSPRVHQWGLRTGTKRRSRPVLPFS